MTALLAILLIDAAFVLYLIVALGRRGYVVMTPLQGAGKGNWDGRDEAVNGRDFGTAGRTGGGGRIPAALYPARLRVPGQKRANVWEPALPAPRSDAAIAAMRVGGAGKARERDKPSPVIWGSRNQLGALHGHGTRPTVYRGVGGG